MRPIVAEESLRGGLHAVAQGQSQLGPVSACISAATGAGSRYGQCSASMLHPALSTWYCLQYGTLLWLASKDHVHDSAARNSGVLHEVAKPDLCTAWPSASPGAALASKSHSIGASSQCSCRMRLVSSHHCVRSVWVLPLCGACAMKNQQSNKGWSQRSSMRLGSPCTTQKVLRDSLCSMYLCFLLCHPMGWSRSNQISTPRCPLQWPDAKHRKVVGHPDSCF